MKTETQNISGVKYFDKFVTEEIQVFERRDFCYMFGTNKTAVYYIATKRLYVSSMVYYFIKWELKPIREVLSQLEYIVMENEGPFWAGFRKF